MKNKLSKYRKALVLLPLIAVPVLAIVMLLMKFTHGRQEKSTVDTVSMLNKSLPDPVLKDKEKNKLEAYMEAEADSVEKKKTDERHIQAVFDPLPPQDTLAKKYYSKGKHSGPVDLAERERKVNEQLDGILKELNKSSELKDTGQNQSSLSAGTETSPDIARLEQMMNMLNGDTAEDPEMRRLDAMLDKIIKIQQPQNAKPDIRDTLTKHNSANLAPVDEHEKSSSAFYGLEQSPLSLSRQKSAIRAVVHEDQTLVDGSLIKLRLLENIYIGQQEVPAGNFIYGVCSIADERLKIELDRLVYNGSIYPVKLFVYDTDGLPGISVPGAITRDAAKQGIDRTIQSLGMTSLDPSLAAQAASAGIESLKSLLSKKVKLVKVNVKAGHQIYLQ